jgi:hypothetical protein
VAGASGRNDGPHGNTGTVGLFPHGRRQGVAWMRRCQERDFALGHRQGGEKERSRACRRPHSRWRDGPSSMPGQGGDSMARGTTRRAPGIEGLVPSRRPDPTQPAAQMIIGRRPRRSGTETPVIFLGKGAPETPLCRANPASFRCRAANQFPCALTALLNRP